IDFGDGVRRHPTQIYESLFHLVMAGVLMVVASRGWMPRQRLKLYLIADFLYRFATEFIRPEPPGVWGLTFFQWVGVAAIFGLSIQWWFDRRGPDCPSGPSSYRPAVEGSGGFAEFRQKFAAKPAGENSDQQSIGEQE